MRHGLPTRRTIVALRNEKGSYNDLYDFAAFVSIVALRNEKGSYNWAMVDIVKANIVAL